MLHKVRFNGVEDIKEFVDAASDCDFDVDISYDRVVVDAKSFLGVMGMGLGKALVVCCHGEDGGFEHRLRKWAVA